MANKAWEKNIIQKLATTGELGKESADYIRQNNVRLKFIRHFKSGGAMWFFFRHIILNTRYYSINTRLNDPKMLSLLVHEVHHLKQGALVALSVYGELEAWQVEFRYYKKIHRLKLHPAIEKILTLPLNYDRDNLRHAAKLMQNYAGKNYHIDWLPLYPLHKEVGYWMRRK